MSARVTITQQSFMDSIQDASVGIAVLALGGTGTVLRANRTLCEALGYSEQELIAGGLTAVTHPEDLEVTESFRTQIRAFQSIYIEKRYRHRDGHYLWMLVGVVPLRDEDGVPQATLAHFFDISKRKRSEAQLAESEWRYRQILQTTADGFWAYDPQRMIVTANDRIAQMLGYDSQADVLGTHLDDHLFPEDHAASRVRQSERRAGVQHGTYEVRMRRRDGQELWVEITPNHFLAHDGADAGGFAFLRDITDRRTESQELARALQLRSLLAANLPNTAAMLFDRDLRFLLVEGSGVQQGWPEDLLNKTVAEVSVWTPQLKAQMTEHFQAALAGEVQIFDRVDGEHVFATTISPVREEDGAVYAGLVVSREVTQARRASRQLKELAELDTLTGLPNRATLRDELARTLAARSPGLLMFLDLDNFKAVNDSLGHDAGDELLKEIARRLSHSVRAQDLVARLSGDEFCVLLRGVDDRTAAAVLAQRTLDTLTRPVLLDGADVFVAASIGVARLGHDGGDVRAMLTAADMAMYAAKGAGRHTYRFFEPEMAQRAQARLALSSDLRRAIDRDELTLHYQPQLQLAGEAVTSLEALVRWHHPEQGPLAPAVFIDIAEESGFIITLGDWVLRSACEQLVRWRAEGLTIPKLAVNVSVKQLTFAEFPAMVAAALADSGLPGDSLELEITESALMDLDLSLKALGELKRIGVSVAIDDFGTGYSSLARLRRLPIDVLKIDRAFVADADTDSEAAAVVRSIIALAHNLDMHAIAEGVERGAQRDLLLAEGCDMAGGWLWTRALPADQLPSWLEGHASGPGRHLRAIG